MLIIMFRFSTFLLQVVVTTYKVVTVLEVTHNYEAKEERKKETGTFEDHHDIPPVEEKKTEKHGEEKHEKKSDHKKKEKHISDKEEKVEKKKKGKKKKHKDKNHKS